MYDKTSIAKIGVLVLIGLNIGAYYLFWPRQDGGAKSDAQVAKAEKGETKLLPTPAPKQPSAPTPKELPASPQAAAIPLAPPKFTGDASTDETVTKLIEHIKKESEGGKILPAAAKEKVGSLPIVPPFPEIIKPKDLPPLDVGSPLSIPKEPTDVWLVRTEKMGNVTLLIAKLRESRQVVEFRIHCDRVEPKGPDGSVQAIGRVMFAGGGTKGACQRLTLQSREARIVLEEQVYIEQDATPGSNLRGERMTLEFPSSTAGEIRGLLK